jgi:lipopolysaccharide/colanic/teichoic acid biosynthesis glycosyltransferase
LVALVRLTSAGPGFYRQVRTGRNGVTFLLYKIRTMYQDAESVSGPCWCLPGDSRITPLGRVLRVLHLDELPQLINVARGEMDLIGPRPERPEFVAKLAREIPHYYARLQILPGVTGLAQINLPPDTTSDCVRKKLVLDCAYIREASFWLDVRILVCTFLRMIGIRHGLAAQWLRVKRHVGLTTRAEAGFNAEPSRWSYPEYAPAMATGEDGQQIYWALVTTGVGLAEGEGAVDVMSALDLTTHPLRRPR